MGRNLFSGAKMQPESNTPVGLKSSELKFDIEADAVGESNDGDLDEKGRLLRQILSANDRPVART
jgi:hypothetical protein